MIRTKVGYAGGSKKLPTYENLGDHSETIQIVYDPTIISYSELLEIFWQDHEPTVPPYSRQYMSSIFYHNEEQQRFALRTKDYETNSRKRKVLTAIIPFETFWPAEDYHQKYYLRDNRLLIKEFSTLYSSPEDFTNSTAAARVNGFAGGNGTIEDLKSELKLAGLEPESVDRIVKAIKSR